MKVVDSAEASFQVDNYENYVSIQSESALRTLATHYAYDSHEKDGISLRANTDEIANRLRHEIQERLAVAGVSVEEARISHLAYAPEIAAAMLQRQQASAIVAARFMVSAAVCEPAILVIALRGLQRGLGVSVDEEVFFVLRRVMTTTLLVDLFLFAAEVFTELWSGSRHADSMRYLLLGLEGHHAVRAWVWASIGIMASAAIVNDLFGTGASLRSVWTVAGLAGFLFWGIPMSAQVAKVWARAFQRERFPFWGEVWRGAVWFVVLMVTQTIGLMLVRRPTTVLGFLVNLLSFAPGFLLWAVSPVILIRNGRIGWRQFAWCGLVGVVLDNLFARITLRWVFPRLLDGWVGFGPIGAAMALMTTCTIIAALWVASACLGAVLWERKAPADTVVDSQQAAPATAPTQPTLPF